MRGTSGLTLVEAVVGLAVAFLMVGAVIGFYVHAHKAEIHGGQALDSLEDAQGLMARLQEDLQALAPPPGTPAADWVVVRDGDGDGFPEVSFSRWAAVDEDTGRPSRVEVTYGLRSDALSRTSSDGGPPWSLSRDSLREFSVVPRFGYWTTVGGRRTYLDDASAPPAPGEGTVTRFEVVIDIVLQQSNRTGEPTTRLPVTVRLAPRAFNAGLGSHWIGSSEE